MLGTFLWLNSTIAREIWNRRRPIDTNSYSNTTEITSSNQPATASSTTYSDYEQSSSEKRSTSDTSSTKDCGKPILKIY